MTGEAHMLAGGGRLQLRLPGTEAAVGVARRAVEVVGFSTEPEVREDAQLVVSELVTNGLQHGQGGVTLSLSVSERGRLRGEVVDEGDGFEPPPTVDPESAAGGWGLSIVATLAEKWGIERGTTRVWFEMPDERIGA